MKKAKRFNVKWRRGYYDVTKVGTPEVAPFIHLDSAQSAARMLNKNPRLWKDYSKETPKNQGFTSRHSQAGFKEDGPSKLQ